jgi:methionyl aminopeptidase
MLSFLHAVGSLLWAHWRCRPGVTCDEIDRVVHETITEGGGYPSPLNYYCFPKSVCTSVNEVICHGIPDARELVEGDIVNVDVTAYLGGYHGDLNETFLVGKVAPEVKKLVRTAYECLHKAIDICKPGTRYRDIGDIVSTHASKNGCAHGPICSSQTAGDSGVVSLRSPRLPAPGTS